MLEVLDFLERLAPFSQPDLLVRDHEPLLQTPGKIDVQKESKPARSSLDLLRESLGQARGPDYNGLLRYAEIDRWSPIPVRDYPYDLEICDLCVRQCPIEQRADQCDAGTPPSGDSNQCPPQGAIRLLEIEGDDGVTRMRPEILDGCVSIAISLTGETTPVTFDAAENEPMRRRSRYSSLSSNSSRCCRSMPPSSLRRTSTTVASPDQLHSDSQLVACLPDRALENMGNIQAFGNLWNSFRKDKGDSLNPLMLLSVLV